MPVNIANPNINEYYKLVYNPSAANFCVTLDKLDVPFPGVTLILIEDQTTNYFGQYANTFDLSQNLFKPGGLLSGKTWNDCWDANERLYKLGQNVIVYQLYASPIDLGQSLANDTELTLSWEQKEFIHFIRIYYSSDGTNWTSWNKDTQYRETATYNCTTSWEGNYGLYINIDGKYTNYISNGGGQPYWKRIGITFKVPAGTRYLNILFDGYWAYQYGYKRGGWLRNFQLEMKPYPTSFVAGSRPNGCLDIPFELKDNFVISFWFKPRWKWSQSVWTTLSEQTYNLVTFGLPGTHGFLFRRTNANLNLETYAPTLGSSYTQLSNFDTQNKNGYVHFVLIKTGTTMYVYANGNKIITLDNPNYVSPPLPTYNYLRFGARDTGNWFGRLNGLFADIYIGKYNPSIWTDEFIKKIYDTAKSFAR